MYSSLSACGQLDEIDDVRLATLVGREEGAHRHVLVVRDPYRRLASFYADKLQRNLAPRNGEWQFCQLMFLQHVGIGLDASTEIVRGALSGISFEMFIDLLPQVSWNGHLRPQSSLLEADGLNLRPITEVIPMEDKSMKLWSLLAIPDPPRANRNTEPSRMKSLDRRRLDTINAVYALDFESFGYECR